MLINNIFNQWRDHYLFPSGAYGIAAIFAMPRPDILPGHCLARLVTPWVSYLPRNSSNTEETTHIFGSTLQGPITLNSNYNKSAKHTKMKHQI